MSNTNMLVKFDQIQGESGETNHKGYSNILEWSCDIDRPESWGAKNGMAEGKAIPRLIKVVQSVDSTVTELYTKLVQGAVIKYAHLAQKKSDGQDASQNYIDLKFQEVYIKDVKFWLAPDHNEQIFTPKVAIHFVYNFISIAYKVQDKKDHSLGSTKRFTYDVRQNNTSFDSEASGWLTSDESLNQK